MAHVLESVQEIFPFAAPEFAGNKYGTWLSLPALAKLYIGLKIKFLQSSSVWQLNMAGSAIADRSTSFVSVITTLGLFTSPQEVRANTKNKLKILITLYIHLILHDLLSRR